MTAFGQRASASSKRLSQLFTSLSLPEQSLSIGVFLSYDILYSAPLSRYAFIINPANEALCGTLQPYFPVGGPVPPPVRHEKALSSSRWGGMEAGENMLYGVQVLDGCIHDECGPQLLSYLQSLPEREPFTDNAGQRIRCPVGSAITSPTFGSLKGYFDGIIHTVPPFRSDTDWNIKLQSCYVNSFALAWPRSLSTRTSVASVLLGTGCRGIAIDEAAEVAAKACLSFARRGHSWNNTACEGVSSRAGEPLRELHFVLREEEHCRILTDHLNRESSLLER
jgi:O-acetyl-ADP-ribose deacetylase (regulator of RNase III)